METKPLVVVRVTTLYGPADAWGSTYRPIRRECEPLILDILNHRWAATGERDERGELLYRAVEGPYARSCD